MEKFWNERYSSKEYVYGIEPNVFLEGKLKDMPKGTILFPMEGEGRNAVFAASIGFEVTAFDYSYKGKQKADSLAKSCNVKVDYKICTVEDFKSSVNFQTIALFYTHVFPELKPVLFNLVHSNLEEGGIFIAEFFSKNQFGKASGGPKDITMLFSKEEIEQEFVAYSEVTVVEEEVVLNEGSFHQGNASVLRVYAIK